jgi:hypothetical protein
MFNGINEIDSVIDSVIDSEIDAEITGIPPEFPGLSPNVGARQRDYSVQQTRIALTISR